MKKLFLIFLMLLSITAFAQTDGQRSQAQIKFVSVLPATCVPNQSLIYAVLGTPINYYVCTQTNTFASITASGGTPGGSNKQVQFNNSSAFGGATGFEYQAGASPNVLITAQNATHVPLQLKLASAQSSAGFEMRDSGGNLLSSFTPTGGYTVAGDSTISLTGTNTTFPRKLRLSNIGAGTAFRQEYESEGTSIMVREGGKFQISGRYGVKIVGSRNSTFAPSFETGSSTDPSLFVENGNTGAIPLRVNAISSTSTNLFEVQSNGANRFVINNQYLGLFPYAGGAGNTFELRFFELAANGTDSVVFKAPDSLSNDLNFTLPSALPATNGQPLLSSSAGVISFPTGTPNGSKFLRDDGSWQAVSGSGANTSLSNLSAVAISDGDGDANLATGAGINLLLSATAPVATTGASQAGKTASLSASNAVASTDTAGAAAGGSVTITAGNAARLTSGNANGGSIFLVTGSGVGTGTSGQVVFPLGVSTAPGITFTGDTDTGFYAFGNNQFAVTLGGNLVGIFSSTTDVFRLGQGGQFNWSNSSNPQSSFGAAGLTSNASATVRVTNGSTGAGSLIIGTSTVGSIGTSGVGVLAIANGTAPNSSPADQFQLYSADSAASNANAFIRNELGQVNRLSGLGKMVFVQEDATSDTTLTDIPDLIHSVETNRSYAFTAVLYTTSNVANGIKFAVGGTCTPNFIIYEADVTNAGTFVAPGTVRATTKGNTVGDVTAVTAAKVVIRGSVDVTTGGTLSIQFAQNVSGLNTSSVLVGSTFHLHPVD